MNSPANIIRRHLIDRAYGAATGNWATFVSFLPNDPNQAICIYDTAGRMDGRLMRDGFQIIHPGVQILVRGKTYLETYRKAKTIALYLDTIQGFSVVMAGDAVYLLRNVSRTGDLMPLGVETDGDRRRYLFAINAVLTFTESPIPPDVVVPSEAISDAEGAIYDETGAIY